MYFIIYTHIIFNLADRPLAHSEESRLANLLRRASREDDRERRLATVKQMREFIVHSENKVVGKKQIYFCACKAVKTVINNYILYCLYIQITGPCETVGFHFEYPE